MHHVFVLLLLSLYPLALGSKYKYKNYPEMVNAMTELSAGPTNSKLNTLKTTQVEFGLPTVGTCPDPASSSTSSPKVKCLNYYMTLTSGGYEEQGNKVKITNDPLPEVFFSGEVHGNEQVGPHAVLEAARILLLASECVQLRRENPQQEDASECWPYDDYSLFWLSRLVATRRSVISPMSNAMGFSDIVRVENRIDPNRDFAYDPKSPNTCMQTIAARHINEIFRSHLFQLAITFHGGMTAIAYEWGSPGRNVGNKKSPDDSAQREIAHGMSEIGGTFASEVKYPYGTMNNVVYEVHGGMEDWGYAGSWDTQYAVSPKAGEGGCTPSTYGGYSTDKTFYNGAVLRAFNVLVEASRIKKPAESHLGDSEDLFNPASANNGHVPRNVRLVLLMIDVVEPYLRFASVRAGSDEVELLSHDLAPLTTQTASSCLSTHAVEAKKGDELKTFTVEWEVGGGFSVDNTNLFYGKLSEVKDAGAFSCNPRELDSSSLDALTTKTSHKLDGKTRWSDSNAAEYSHTARPTFTETIDLSRFEVNDEIVIFARCTIDKKEWTKQETTPLPDLPPQSHVVNARTNEDWDMASGGKMVKGRLDWFSVPIVVKIVAGGASVEDASSYTMRDSFDNNDCTVDCDGEGKSQGGDYGSDDDLQDGLIDDILSGGIDPLIPVACLLMVIGLYCMCCAKGKMRGTANSALVGSGGAGVEMGTTKYLEVAGEEDETGI